MRRTPARRVERESALWRGFLSCGSSENGFVISLGDRRHRVQLSHIIQGIKPAGKLATSYFHLSPGTGHGGCPTAPVPRAPSAVPPPLAAPDPVPGRTSNGSVN